MISQTPKELLDKGLIDQDQYQKINLIVSGKIISVFYELRTLLYLGIMLLSTGLGILIYQNIGDLGHLIAVSVLTAMSLACFYYIQKHAPFYSNEKVKSPTPYFDYIVLLTALLFMSTLAYLQFLYEIFEHRPGLITLTTSLLFFYMAYRFDHIGILSLAITALASFWSISITPQQWITGNFYGFENLYNTGIVFSVLLAGAALILDRKNIKTHFTFTYINLATLIFFVSCITAMFQDEWYLLYLLLIYAGCVFSFYMARWKRSFMFLLYAFLSAYIGTTYLLVDTVMSDTPELWFVYSILSCGGFIYFIIKFKSYFKQA